MLRVKTIDRFICHVISWLRCIVVIWISNDLYKYRIIKWLIKPRRWKVRINMYSFVFFNKTHQCRLCRFSTYNFTSSLISCGPSWHLQKFIHRNSISKVLNLRIFFTGIFLQQLPIRFAFWAIPPKTVWWIFAICERRSSMRGEKRWPNNKNKWSFGSVIYEVMGGEALCRAELNHRGN